MLERALDFRILENVSLFFQSLRVNTLTGEQRRVRHLAEDETRGKSWYGKDRRARQCAAQSFRELLISRGIGRDRVDRAAQFFVIERELDDANRVVKRNPTHI